MAIIGDLVNQWPGIKELCDQSTTDDSGVGVGILTRKITTDFGQKYNVKFLLLFVDQKLYHNLKPTFRYTMKEITQEGFENVLMKIGRKTIINAQRKLDKVKIQ